MKTYFINTYRNEESEKVMATLAKYVVKDVYRKSAIMHHETIRFECEKEEWKKIKKELNLEVTHVFSKIKFE